ncbi:MAG: tRNA (guanosine(37)-N1)-methyltransferase TrmD [Candidatus Gracilibacteria bacterium]|nr:tRNA (guanosine(37)-N1)-methyltransferase TrmD [Candidatus Gracilibacteria bacterium]MDD3119797.1 tRNA (guanosine(37)-N1)-methyltransferase TrmD [Candidatus Gracilibacteria bacterium]MDD4530184.1 tRNA (guanosine(37)-N1)-methyltransferase TrmD [Candidatus Gracilibacteria bacterium]
MKFHIITIFPGSFESYFNSSILKNAKEKGLFEPIFYNLCDFSVKNTRRVDDRPYGGFPGTVISVEPLYKAIEFIEKKAGKSLKKIFLSPTGKIFNQKMVSKMVQKFDEIIIICGHYEGIDARIFEIFQIEQISIGKYVITSGELATMVFIDALVRYIPGVLSKDSLREESFSLGLSGKKEYPQYTRPEEFQNHKVPIELLSGNPKTIDEWKKKNLG